ARDAEVFLDAALIGDYFKLQGYNIQEMNFPPFKTFKDLLNHIERAWSLPPGEDQNYVISIDILTSIVNILRSKFAKRINKPELLDIVFKNYYSAFQRRVEYFKQCVQMREKTGFSIEDLDDKKEALRLWQQLNAGRVVESREPEFVSKFQSSLLDQIMLETVGLELNEGCTVQCDFCAFEPDKEVKNKMPFAEAAWFALRASYPNFAFFKSTDPLDYSDPDDPSLDVADLITIKESSTGDDPFISTAYPKNSDGKVKKIGDRLSRLSISHMNDKRLVRDGFCERVDEDILVPTDPDLADALYFSGTRSFNFVNEHVVGQIQTSDEDVLTKLLTASNYNTDGVSYLDESHIVESGRWRDVAAKKKGVGAIDTISKSISCMDGVVASPGHFKNIISMFSSPNFRRGEILADILPQNLIGGAKKIGQFKKELAEGKPLNIKDLLPYVVVKYKYGNPSLGRSFGRGINLNSTHVVGLKIFDDIGECLGYVVCEYSQVDGTVYVLG
ncbi:MAG: hypothetical protein ACD_72C00290G0001, partial [uncultured bacterium]